MFNSINKISKSSEVTSSLGYWSLLLLTAVLPLFVIGASYVPSLMVKTLVGSILICVVLFFFVITQIRAQEISLPRSLIVGAAWLIPLAYIFSALFSPGGSSFFGEQPTMDGVVFMTLLVSALTIASVTLNLPQRALGFYLSLLASVALLTVVEMYIFFFARDTLSSLGLQSISLVGTLNDLGVFFGLIIIFVLLSLILLPLTLSIRTVLFAVLATSSFFLTVVNLLPLWWIVGGFSLSFLVYTISTKRSFEHISFASLFVFLLSMLFIFVTPLVSSISNWTNVGEFDVRPSWGATVSIADQALSNTSMLFGTGPGTFSNIWFQYMPPSINVTAFWLTPFPYGVGLIPTSVITTGLLGAIAWIFFLASFLWTGGRGTLLSNDATSVNIANYIRITSFVASLYLWINAIIQVPSPVLVIYAALLTGVFVASLHFGTNSVKYIKITFRENTKVGFIATLSLTVAMLGSVAGVFGFVNQYIAEASFQKATKLVTEEGKVDEAYDLTLKAVERNNIDIYYRLMSNLDIVRIEQLVAQNKPPDEIREEYEKLLARSISNAMEATVLDKHDYQNWVNLGNVYQSNVPYGVEGVIDSALAAYDQALALHPNSPSVYYAKAALEHYRGDNMKAREYVQKAITLRNQYTDAIFLLAQIQIENAEVESAIKSVKAITLFSPLNSTAFFQLGLLHYAAEDFTQAAEALERAVAIDQQYANARYFLGLSYWRLNNTARSLEEFKKVQELNPDNEEVATAIANIEAGKDPFTQPATTTAADIQAREGLPFDGEESPVEDLPFDRPQHLTR